ncbi:MAG: FtsX-like permease family protein [Pseudomonadota bacterium]
MNVAAAGLGAAAPVGAVVRVLLSHWRRQPVQLIALLIGLAAATALWSGVQALNAEARASYDRAANQIAGGVARLVPRAGDTVDQADWVALRRAGWPVSPVLEVDVTVAGARLRLLGVDPLSLPGEAGIGLATVDDASSDAEAGQGGGLASFTMPPFQTLASAATLRRIGAAPGETPALQGAPQAAGLPPLVRADGVPGGTLVVDIGVAQRLTGREGALSYLLVQPVAQPRAPLVATVEGRLRQVEPERPEDLDRLTASFHLNLTAFGLLSFTVGLFIVHAAVGLAFEQRRAMLRTLRAVGVSAATVTVALAVEILSIALIAGLAGLAGGYVIAAALLPDVAATVGGLYGTEVDGALALRPAWVLAGLAMALVGALAAAAQSLYRAATMPVLESALPQAWAASQGRWLQRQAVLAAGIALVGLAVPQVADGAIAGFAMMAAVIVAAALMLPVLLAAALSFAERRAAPGLPRWFWADSRQQLSGLSLALMALLLALAVNIGVGTMVGSFRTTFTGWIEDRLAADAYLRAETPAQAAAILDWLAAEPAVERALPTWSADTRVQGWPTEVYGFADDPLYRARWPLLAAVDGVWDRVAAGEAALVSEQMSYRLGLAPGDALAVPTATGVWQGTVAGIYADYGNPRLQVRVSVDALTAGWPDVERLSFGVTIAEGQTARVVAGLRDRFGLGPDRLRDQESLVDLSLAIFERTFVVTGALNTLTLSVAGVALLTSLVTLAGLRLPQLAPVWAVGLTRGRLGALELAKMLALAAVTALAALPLGLAVAWLLLAVINVEAFGWRLPMHLFPGDWVRLWLLALVTALAASLLPVWRLTRMAPARLIAVFATAR